MDELLNLISLVIEVIDMIWFECWVCMIGSMVWVMVNMLKMLVVNWCLMVLVESCLKWLSWL